MERITTRELRRILNNYTDGNCFNKTAREMRKYIRKNFNCSEYTVRTLAKEFSRN